MIGRLKGTLLTKQPPTLLLDVNGVGYEVDAPMSTFYQLPDVNQEVILHTHLVVREDVQQLCGFATEAERRMFRSLIKINGVGPKLALSILSAISADDFLTENVSAIDENVPFGGAIVGAIFLWSQNTPKSRYNNGNQKFNFSQSDYAIINLTTEIAGGDEVIPNRFIPSGQGFFIAYDHAAAGTEISPGSNIKESTIKFTNSMRMADATSNSQFFRGPGNLYNKLWINLTSDNGVFSQIAVAYVDGATHRYDGSAYDTKRISSIPRAATIYTKINGEKDRRFAIQTKSPANLTINEVIHLGFKTDISIPTLYKFSIPKLEGSFLETNNIYVKDNLLNKVHNLLDSDYTFTSETGEFNKRFDIVFKSKSNSFEKIA